MSALPTLHVTSDDPLTLDVDVLVVPVFRGGIAAPGAERVLRELGYREVPRDHTFRGKVGETMVLGAPGLRCGRVVLVGLGRMDGLDDEVVRRAAGAATNAVAESARTLATTLPLVHPSAEAARAAAEGAALGTYRFDGARDDAKPVTLEQVTLVVPSSIEDAARALLPAAAVHAEAQCFVRDLVNRPTSDLGPDELIAAAIERCGSSCDVEVWDEVRLAAERCGAILGVGGGSVHPPRLLRLHYLPADPIGSIALVGKGIVYDAGGLQLKRPREALEAMKTDMAGAANVIAACGALAALDVRVEVLGICAIAENAFSGDAQRPGDVVTARDGTTIEVLDTDAEGRLVLADALAYAAEHQVDAIVDVATLTASAITALGSRATAVFGSDDDLVRQLLDAGADAGEASWRLPLWDDMREHLESPLADLRNIGGKARGDAILGALFLREFVADRPWVHLDIAGPAWATESRHHLPKGGTGVGVRTLLRWLEALS